MEKDNNYEYDDTHSIDGLKIFLNSTIDPLGSKEEEIELVKKAQNGDLLARNEIIERNIRLVVSLGKKYCNKGIDYDELIQEGCIGLIIAIEKFDLTKDYRFCSYAGYWIEQRMNRYIKSNNRSVRLPEYLYDIVSKVNNFIMDYLQQNFGNIPTYEIISSSTRLSMAEVLNAIMYLEMPTSLNKKVGKDNDMELGEILESTSENEIETAENDIFYQELLDAIENSNLSEREKLVVFKRFGINEEHEYLLSEIGNDLGITHEGANYILKTALNKLRNYSAIKDYKLSLV